MASWQYSGPVKTNQGYQVATKGTKASEARYTVYLETPDGEQHFCFIHEVDADFQISGSYAQSARKRDWYPRSFSQVSVSFTGQASSQAEYHNLTEFIRRAQRHSLDWKNATTRQASTTKLGMPLPRNAPARFNRRTGKRESMGYSSHLLFGHIGRIERISERYVVAPEYRFDFLVSFAHQGLFHTRTANREVAMQKLKPWMDVFVHNKNSTWQESPDLSDAHVGPVVAPGPNGELRPT